MCDSVELRVKVKPIEEVCSYERKGCASVSLVKHRSRESFAGLTESESTKPPSMLPWRWPTSAPPPLPPPPVSRVRRRVFLELCHLSFFTLMLSAPSDIRHIRTHGKAQTHSCQVQTPYTHLTMYLKKNKQTNKANIKVWDTTEGSKDLFKRRNWSQNKTPVACRCWARYVWHHVAPCCLYAGTACVQLYTRPAAL